MLLGELAQHREQHDGFVGREDGRQEPGPDFADVFFAEIADQGAAANLFDPIEYPPILASGCDAPLM